MTSGCYILKTVPADNLTRLHDKRNIMRIHSNDSLWLLTEYRVNEGVLTGKVGGDTGKIVPGKVVDVYIAPSDALHVDGIYLSVPVSNIGKVDYPGHDALQITVGAVLGFLFVVAPGLFAM